MLGIGRREFITLLGGAAAGWPLAARAQQMRRVCVLLTSRVNAESRIEIIQQGLQRLGWADGQNVLLSRLHR
jgi:putative tryptophan/tyrosine transport system substrate-binding protein